MSQIKITEEQAGGRKGSATVDHILRTKELIRLNKLNKKTTYITFLDVTKAYDKAWLDAIMYTMDKQGCNGAIWNLTDKLNQNLTATIRTSIGQTRTIRINNSIRQGGVLAVTQYAALMDEINKEIQNAKQLKESTINPNSTCLLWVDDVAIITDNINDQKTLLKITEETANKYRIQFGKNKSQTMTIGKSISKEPTLGINEMHIEPCAQYKYLGEIINTKNNLDNHIHEIKRKTEAALQTVLFIAGDENFRGIQLQTIWTLLEACIIPIITYGAETWTLNKTQTKTLNTLLDNILKRLLQIPQTTPRECIYDELDILDIQHRIMLKRMTYAIKIKTKPGTAMQTILKDAHNTSWISKTKIMMTEIGLNYETLGTLTYNEAKKNILSAVKRTKKQSTSKTGREKSKYIYLTDNKTYSNKRPYYLDNLPRQQVRAIFMTRTRMFKTKGNYKKMYTSQICRGCGNDEETQQHILQECKAIHNEEKTKVSVHEIFNALNKTTTHTAKKIMYIQNIISQW